MLQARPEVAQAEEKTQQWVVMTPDDKKLDPVKTESYLNRLKTAGPVKGKFQQQRITTLDMALGKVDMDFGTRRLLPASRVNTLRLQGETNC